MVVQGKCGADRSFDRFISFSVSNPIYISIMYPSSMVFFLVLLLLRLYVRMPIPRHAMEPNGGNSAELCIERLTRKLSEVEAVVTASEGKANHMRKERDVAKTENEKLRKEVARLKNELLKVRMNSALREKEVPDELDVKDGSKGTGNYI